VGAVVPPRVLEPLSAHIESSASAASGATGSVRGALGARSTLVNVRFSQARQTATGRTTTIGVHERFAAGSGLSLRLCPDSFAVYDVMFRWSIIPKCQRRQYLPEDAIGLVFGTLETKTAAI
jgi:hypothetical protein